MCLDDGQYEKCLYECFDKRLLSYKNWVHSYPSPWSLAKAGLFYIQISDCTQCFVCGVIISRWEKSDDAFMEHKKHSPKCGYVKLLSTDKTTIQKFKLVTKNSIVVVLFFIVFVFMYYLCASSYA